MSAGFSPRALKPIIIPHLKHSTQRHKYATEFVNHCTSAATRIDRTFTTQSTETTEGECRNSCPGAEGAPGQASDISVVSELSVVRFCFFPIAIRSEQVSGLMPLCISLPTLWMRNLGEFPF